MVTLSCQLIDPTINSVLRAQQVIFAYVAQTIGNVIFQFKFSPLEVDTSKSADLVLFLTLKPPHNMGQSVSGFKK